ncbi:MAG: hypothetical protein ABSD11_14875, partial [Methylocella sp.]
MGGLLAAQSRSCRSCAGFLKRCFAAVAAIAVDKRDGDGAPGLIPKAIERGPMARFSCVSRIHYHSALKQRQHLNARSMCDLQAAMLCHS